MEHPVSLKCGEDNMCLESPVGAVDRSDVGHVDQGVNEPRNEDAVADAKTTPSGRTERGEPMHSSETAEDSIRLSKSATAPNDVAPWPDTLPAQGLDSGPICSAYFTRLRSSDAFDLIDLVKDTNIQLFQQTYGHACANGAALWQVFMRHEQEPHSFGSAYTIIERSLRKQIGWLVLRPWKVQSAGEELICTLFAVAGRRFFAGPAVIWFILQHAFEVLSIGRVYIRASLTPPEQACGYTVMDVMHRQVRIQDSECAGADLYRFENEAWRRMKPAIAAWHWAEVGGREH